ncbi:MAG TPA: hypothetical protein VHC95_07145 [Opitutales bacterium]|nr:hypothetical protein [Opitutales bacterium]
MPYAPGVSYEGGQLIGQGIQAFGQSLGAGMQQGEALAERLKQFQQQQKEYDDQLGERTDKARAFATDFLGVPDGQAAAMSLGQLEGLHDAYVTQAAQKLQQQQGAEADANTALLQQRLNQNNTDQQAVQDAAASFTGDGDAFVQRLLMAGYDPAKAALMQEHFDRAGDHNFKPSAGAVTLPDGSSVPYVMQNRGQAQFLPPKPAAAQLPPIGHTITAGDGTSLVFAGRTDPKTGLPTYETVRENAKPLDPQAAQMLGGQYQAALADVQKLQQAGPPQKGMLGSWTDAGLEKATTDYNQKLTAAKFKANQLADSLQFKAPFPEAQPPTAKGGKTAASPGGLPANQGAAAPAKLYQVTPQGVQFAPGTKPVDALQQMVDDGVISQAAALQQLQQMGYKVKK